MSRPAIHSGAKVTIHLSAKDADAVPNSERFSNEAALEKLAAEWPAARLVEIWNSLPGEATVRKFKERATGVSRIWKAIQNLGELETGVLVEEPQPEPTAAPVAPEPIAEPAETSEQVEATPEAEAPAPTFQPDTEVATATSQPEVTADAPDTPVAPLAPDVASEVAPAGRKAIRAKKTPRRPKL